MSRWLFACLALVAHLAVASAAQAVELRLIRVYPDRAATLPRSENLYFEVEYVSDQPLRIQARAYREGRASPERQAMNASVAHPAGKGRALVWVSFFEAAAIDEVRITAHDERWTPIKILAVPGRARWMAEPARTWAPTPDWVSALLADEERIREMHAPPAEAADENIGLAIGAIMVLGVPIYLVLQVLGLMRFRGGWRWAAAGPLVVMVPVGLITLSGIAGGSNLWPLLLIFTTPFALVFLVGVYVARSLWPAGRHGA